MIRVMSGMQWGKDEIRVLEGGRVHKKKKIEKMIGMTAIREKREIQWNRSQIMVPTGSRLSLFFYSCRVIL